MEQQKTDVAGKQRIIRSEAQIQLILDEYQATGFSVKDYCEMEDINEATFYSWLKKYRPKCDDLGGFTTIEVTPSVNLVPQLFAEIGNIKLYKEVPVEYLKALLS